MERRDLLDLDFDLETHAFFLDFDGTLAPIVSRPQDARISQSTRDALLALFKRTDGATAVISGRALADIRPLLDRLNLPVAGSHGAEVYSPRGLMVGSAEEPEAFRRAADKLRDFAARLDLLYERKRGAATAHYRSAPELAERCRDYVDQLASGSERLRAIHGDMVSEVALASVNKGAAVELFMASPPFAGRAPVVAGDDTTDEDAFRVAQALGGAAIKVGPGPTCARHRAASIEIFLSWLHRLAGLE